MKKKNHEPTKSDILEAINHFATHVEERFNGVDERFLGVEKRLDRLESNVSGLKSDVSGLKSDVSGLTSNLAYLKTVMVTKDYLDDKLADLRSDLGILIRKEDKKMNSFIRVVRQKKVISPEEAGSLLATGPFSRTN